MEEIKRQVSRAHRRMVFQQFLGVLIWSMFAALLFASIALLVKKIWVIRIDPMVWQWSWLSVSAGAGFATAMIYTYLIRHKPLEAAVEIDRRFGLKERVSSALSLQSSEMATEAGQALLDDAARRVDRIDVRDRFVVALNWRALLPVLPVLAVIALLYFEDAFSKEQQAQAKEQQVAKEQLNKIGSDSNKKKIEQLRKKAKKENLKDAELIFKNIEQGIDELNKSNASKDKQKAMVKLNNLKKEIEKRRDQLGDVEKMRKQLDQLKDIKNGPADKALEALKDGNFKKALQEMDKLKEQIKDGKMNADQMKKMANQLEEMANKMNDLVQRHQQAKRELQKQIEQAEKKGDLAKAGQLQQKLDKLNQQQNQMDQMQKMANKLAKAAQNMKPGKGQQKPNAQQLAQAAEALDEVAQQIQEMQNEMDELETLNEMMDQIADAKNAMNCKECVGGG